MPRSTSNRIHAHGRPADELDRAATLRLFLIMARAMRSLRTLLRENLKHWDLSPSEFAVLEALLHKGPVSLSVLAELVLASGPAITYTAKGLEKRDLLRRRPSVKDQRVVVAELTTAGRRLIERIFPEHVDEMQRAMRGLNRVEKRQAAELLKALGRGMPTLGDVAK